MSRINYDKIAMYRTRSIINECLYNSSFDVKKKSFLHLMKSIEVLKEFEIIVFYLEKFFDDIAILSYYLLQEVHSKKRRFL